MFTAGNGVFAFRRPPASSIAHHTSRRVGLPVSFISTGLGVPDDEDFRSAMQYSTVKWFDAKKGYGFIEHPKDGDDVFVHYSNIESNDDFKTLRAGQDVKFEMNDGPKGLHALNVVASDEDDGNDPTHETQEESTAPEIDPADVDPTAQVDPLAS